MFEFAEIINDRAVINVYSVMNSWMDCIFIVDKKDAEKAQEILEKGMGDWFDNPGCENITYGGWLESRLNINEIEYTVYYIGRNGKAFAE